jgi:hypothetical protein
MREGLLTLLHQAFFGSPGCNLSSDVIAQLCKDVANVCFHRAFTEISASAISLLDHPRDSRSDLTLAFGKPIIGPLDLTARRGDGGGMRESRSYVCCWKLARSNSPNIGMSCSIPRMHHHASLLHRFTRHDQGTALLQGWSLVLTHSTDGPSTSDEMNRPIRAMGSVARPTSLAQERTDFYLALPNAGSLLCLTTKVWYIFSKQLLISWPGRDYSAYPARRFACNCTVM